MKTKTMMILTVLVSVLMAAGNYAQSDDGTEDNLRTFMRLKLKHAQEVLEGLSVENYDQIAEGAQEIGLLSQASQWQVLQTPEYVRRSTEFRRAAEAISKAAKDRNLDGATLGYVNVTMKCVACHKYVRSVQNAKLELPKRDFAESLKWDGKESLSGSAFARWVSQANLH